MKNPWGKTSWMTSDEVSKLAIKRMIYLVWINGQRKLSDLMILCSSVLDEVIKFMVISGVMDELWDRDFM